MINETVLGIERFSGPQHLSLDFFRYGRGELLQGTGSLDNRDLAASLVRYLAIKRDPEESWAGDTTYAVIPSNSLGDRNYFVAIQRKQGYPQGMYWVEIPRKTLRALLWNGYPIYTQLARAVEKQLKLLTTSDRNAKPLAIELQQHQRVSCFLGLDEAKDNSVVSLEIQKITLWIRRLVEKRSFLWKGKRFGPEQTLLAFERLQILLLPLFRGTVLSGAMSDLTDLQLNVLFKETDSSLPMNLVTRPDDEGEMIRTIMQYPFLKESFVEAMQLWQMIAFHYTNPIGNTPSLKETIPGVKDPSTLLNEYEESGLYTWGE